MDFQSKLRQFAEQAEKATKDAVQKAGELAHDKRDDVTSGLDKVAAKVDARTEGKYTDKLAKAKTTIMTGVDKLAEQRPADGAPSGETGTPSATQTEPPASAPSYTPPTQQASAEPVDPTLHEPPR